MEPLTLTPSEPGWRAWPPLPVLCPLPELRALATLPALPTLLRSPPAPGEGERSGKESPAESRPFERETWVAPHRHGSLGQEVGIELGVRRAWPHFTPASQTLPSDSLLVPPLCLKKLGAPQRQRTIIPLAMHIPILSLSLHRGVDVFYAMVLMQLAPPPTEATHRGQGRWG